MTESYERDLDLNLLRVFVVVAESGSVTEAARRLYVTQPAVSAAIRRLTAAVGAPLFVRAGRGLAMTARGKRILAGARPHLEALIEVTRAPQAFDPRTSERTISVGLSDASEIWLLPQLLARMSERAPQMRLIVRSVQFRTVAEALASRAVDVAVTVADELPADIERARLFRGGFVCLFDPRRARIGRKISLARYLEQDHVIVSYNGDLRGIVEDMLKIQRRVRVSVPSFHAVGPLVEGSALVATVPEVVARSLVALHPALAMASLPFDLEGAWSEMLWRRADQDDEAHQLVRQLISACSSRPRSPSRRRASAPATRGS